MTNADNGPDNLVLRFLREIDRKVDRLDGSFRPVEFCPRPPAPGFKKPDRKGALLLDGTGR